MEKPEPVPQGVSDFLDDTLPNDGGEHTLALGHHHRLHGQMEWVTTYLDELYARNVRTIGIEMAPYMNPIFWAYKEGRLGSKEEAARKIHSYVLAYGADNPEKLESLKMEADVIISALDRGMEIVAFDSRHSTTSWQQGLDHWNQQAKAGAKLTPLKSFLLQANNKVLSEFNALMQHEPYRFRMQQIDNMITLGEEKIANDQFGYDSLSAALFQAMAVPGKARVTLSGLGHIDGILSADKLDLNVDSVFPQHLFAQANGNKQGHKVTRAVLAATGELSRYRDLRASTIAEGKSIRIVNGDPIPMLDVTTGKKENLPHPKTNDARYLPYEDFFAEENKLQGIDFSSSNYANPLLIPAFKQLADALKGSLYSGAAKAIM